MLDEIIRLLDSSENIVFVTGAGISQESGIPTFRGTDGLWRNYDPMVLATIDAFEKNPALVWQWYDERRKNILNSKPNFGHIAISKLEKIKNVSVLTQNIDGLHQRAGSKNVLELHGSIIRIRCTQCSFSSEITSDLKKLPPFCNCGNLLRPDVVWFGEPLPVDVWTDAINISANCDLMLIVGTSLAVSPANTLPYHAKQNGASLIEINPEKTLMSEQMDYSIRSTATLALPKILSSFYTKP